MVTTPISSSTEAAAAGSLYCKLLSNISRLSSLSPDLSFGLTASHSLSLHYALPVRCPREDLSLWAIDF